MYVLLDPLGSTGNANAQAPSWFQGMLVYVQVVRVLAWTAQLVFLPALITLLFQMGNVFVIRHLLRVEIRVDAGVV